MRNWLTQVVENKGIESKDALLGVIDPFVSDFSFGSPSNSDRHSSRRQVIDSKTKNSIPEIRWHLLPEARQLHSPVLDARVSR